MLFIGVVGGDIYVMRAIIYGCVMYNNSFTAANVDDLRAASAIQTPSIVLYVLVCACSEPPRVATVGGQTQERL